MILLYLKACCSHQCTCFDALVNFTIIFIGRMLGMGFVLLVTVSDKMPWFEALFV